MTQVFNVRGMTVRRRLLRNNQTKTENILWQYLRNRNLNGLKFRRQYGVGNYIVDFCCTEIKLIIEVDGAHHFANIGQEYDVKRTETLEVFGFKILRFTVTQVENDINEVLVKILKLAGGVLSPSPYQGEGWGEVKKESVSNLS